MAEGIELATAWVRIVPTVEGITDKLVKEFAPAEDEAGRSGERAGAGWAGKLKGAIGAAAIGAAVVGGFKVLYDVGEIFDDVTDTIRAGTGAQGEALDGLVQSAKNVGLQVPAEFEKIGPTIADLNTRLGLSGETLETVASQYLEAGRILGEEVDINQTTAAFNAFRIEGDAVSGAMDTLFQVSQATGVGMNELAAGVQTAAPALQNLGFTFEDSVALLGSLDKAGLNATQVMASLSKGLVTLAKDGEQPQEAFARVTAELQGFVDTGDTAAALDLASQVFGTRGAAQFVGALQSGVLNMNDLMGATGATGDTILGVGAETMDFAEQWQMTMNTAMVAIEPLASAVFAAVGEGLAFVMPFLQDLGNWVGENTGLIAGIAGVIGVILVAALAAWTAGVIANTVAMLAWPVTWIILGIVAAVALLVAAALWLWENWDAVISWIGDIFTWVWETILKPIVDAIGAIFTWLWENILLPIVTAMAIQFEILGAIFTWLWENAVKPSFDAIGAIFTWLWENVIQYVFAATQAQIEFLGAIFGWLYENAIKPSFDAIGAIFTWLWENVVKPSFDAIGAIFNWLWNSVIKPVSDFISSAISAVGNTIRSVFGGISDFIGSAFNAVISVVRGPVNAIIGLINSVIDGLNSVSVTIPDWVPLVGGQHFGISLPKIPMMADGGTILPRRGGTLAILAEAGRPESVVDTGLLNQALEEGLAGGSTSWPDRIVLVDEDGSILTRARVIAEETLGAAFAPGSAEQLNDQLGTSWR